MQIASLLAVACCLGSPVRDRAQPLARSDFALSASRGCGDRQNSWAWSMVWWEKQRRLYVGTARATSCTDAASVPKGPLGHGRLLESADPAAGNDAFRQVTPEDLTQLGLLPPQSLLPGTASVPADGGRRRAPQP
jgi:hypothetical protein